MRLTYFMDTHIVGGAERYVADLMEGMKREGHQVSMLCHDHPPFVEYVRSRTGGLCPVAPRKFPSIARSAAVQRGLAFNRAARGGLGLLKTPGLLLCYVNFLRAFRTVKNFLEQNPCDVFHVVTGGYPSAADNARAAVLAARAAGVPRRVFTFHNPAGRYPAPAFIEKWLDRNILEAAHQITAASEYSKRFTVDRRLIPASAVRVIHNGIPPSNGAPADARALREELGVRPDAFLIGTIGYMEDRKGHAYLVEAFKTVAERFPQAHLLIVGEGPRWEDLRAQVRALKLEGRVTMPGYVPGAGRFLPAMDLFAFPSVRGECLPYVILDAMAAGLPVVSTNAGGMEEEVVDGVTGRLVPPEDAPALARALTEVLADRARASEMGREGRRRAASDFTLERMLRETEQTYAGGGGKP